MASGNLHWQDLHLLERQLASLHEGLGFETPSDGQDSEPSERCEPKQPTGSETVRVDSLSGELISIL